MTDQTELYFMRRAVQIARKCTPEDGRISLKVGAIIVKDGIALADAFRGESQEGEHAEFIALEEKLKHARLAGCTVYTTLEPCTYREPAKLSCCDRLKERRVARVVIGMLDPNQLIRGRGILALRNAGIDVSFFPCELTAELEELNREFIRDQEAKAASDDFLLSSHHHHHHEELRVIQKELFEAKNECAQLAQENIQLKAEFQEIKKSR